VSKLATRSELAKLCRTLEVEPAELAFLDDAPAESLRVLRVAVYERMFSQDRELVHRLGAVLSRMPPHLAARLAKRAGPLLTARVAAEIPPGRAASLVARIPDAFLADVGVHLDPRRTHEMIRRLPVERVVAVARELARRGDFITMSRFVDFLEDDVIDRVVTAIEDERALLQVTFFMGSKNRVDHFFGRLPRERVEALILEVQEEPETLMPAFLSLLVHVSYGLKRQLGDLAAAQDESVPTGYVRAAQALGVWPDVLPVVAAMSDASRRTMVNLPVLREPAVQESIVAAADDADLWGLVLPLVDLMDEENRDAVARIVAARPRQTLENAANAALMGEHWETLLDLVRRMPPSKQGELGAIVRHFGDADPELASRIGQRAEAHDLELALSR
jgi:hypothetical protein